MSIDKNRRIFLSDCLYIFCNYFIAYIPIWSIRKILYKMVGLKIGSGSRISMRCIVSRPRMITIGINTIINEYVLLDGRGGLSIGDNNSISMFSKIYTGTHVSDSSTFEYIGKSTIIKNNCWIGTSSIILPGSILNDFTIIGANSVFKGTSEEKDIWVGVPAKLNRKRTVNDHYKIEYRSYLR